MPVETGLPFFRKRQSLESLASERPQSLQSVYGVVRSKVAFVLDHVATLEHAHYGPGGSLDTEVKKWLPIVDSVIRPARFSDLINLSQLDAIEDRVQDPTDRLAVSWDTLQQVYELVGKVKEAVTVGLAEDIVTLERVRDFMAKYCLSFSGTEDEALMETATNYERQRQDLERAITINLQNVPLMVEKFETEALKLHQFDFVMREQGEKAGCGQVALLLVFPAACHHVRNACRGLEMWLEADASYAGFLELDVAELAGRRASLEKALHQFTLQAGEHDHRIKSLQRELGACSTDLKRLSPRKIALEAEEAGLREENKDVLVDLDIKEYRRHEMRLLGTDASDSFSRLTLEIDELRTRRPAIDRKLGELKKKQDVVTGKQNRRASLEQALEEERNELRGVRRAARRVEVEGARCAACLDRLREMQRLKASPDTLKKIFHGMPPSPRHAAPNAGRKGKKDTLAAVCGVVAAHVDADWVRLYRALPFHPPRGLHIIKDDIDDIASKFRRNNFEEQARQSLAKWRRLHTRACVEDLRIALQGLRKVDVLERLDVALTPRGPALPPRKIRTVHFPKLPATHR